MRTQRVDECGSWSSKHGSRDNRSEAQDVVAGVHHRSSGESLAIPLSHGFCNEAATEQYEREVRSAGTNNAGVRRRDGTQACAGISLKCVAVVIASGSQKNHRARKSAHCPKPLHRTPFMSTGVQRESAEPDQVYCDRDAVNC